MAEPQQIQVRPQQPVEGIKGLLPEKTPSKSQVLAVITLFPVGGILLVLSGLTLTGSLIGLAVATPLFIIFSPILVPAALAIALAVAGFLTSGAFGITALSSFSWIVNYLRQGKLPEHIEHAKGRAEETAGQVKEKVKETGQDAPRKGGQHKFTVLIGILSGLTILATAVIALYLIRRRGVQERREEDPKVIHKRLSSRKAALQRLFLDDKFIEDVTSIESGRPVILGVEEIAKATNNFDAARKLGDGGYGSVYFGSLGLQASSKSPARARSKTSKAQCATSAGYVGNVEEVKKRY
ncbi:Oleosin [Dillenia turbinata]|uniref:Oleosin n=1 Tax=Dillenia turbinata TaxID=194707 RepID=A0AAN8Z2F0_9MAGN